MLGKGTLPCWAKAPSREGVVWAVLFGKKSPFWAKASPRWGSRRDHLVWVRASHARWQFLSSTAMTHGADYWPMAKEHMLKMSVAKMIILTWMCGEIKKRIKNEFFYEYLWPTMMLLRKILCMQVDGHQGKGFHKGCRSQCQRLYNLLTKPKRRKTNKKWSESLCPKNEPDLNKLPIVYDTTRENYWRASIHLLSNKD